MSLGFINVIFSSLMAINMIGREEEEGRGSHEFVCSPSGQWDDHMIPEVENMISRV